MAVAFKTELSKIGKGKFFSSECQLFKDQACPKRHVCEELGTIRKGFFDAVDRARRDAVEEIHNSAASL